MQKKLLTSCFALLSVLTSFSAFSQALVLVNSPASIAGSYAFTNAFDSGWGADLNAGVVTADAVFVNDGSANPTQGCSAPVNAAELIGKIALIDRGTCEFGAKALNAQNAGAVAVIIFNNLSNFPDSIAGIGPGAMGASVTIPVVMLSYANGQAIRAELMNGPVNISIGNIIFPNDLRLEPTRISNPRNGAMPVDQAEASGQVFTPGANVLNRGTSDASDITLQATIDRTPVGGGTSTQVYDESGNLASIENDSSGTILLPEYPLADGEGVYEVTYQVSGGVDDNPEVTADNELTTSFWLSDNVYSKGGWDFTNNRPAATNFGRTVSGGGNVEFLAGFEVPNGLGFKLDSLAFYFFTGGTTLGGLGEDAITGYVYEWDDANTDNLITNDEITTVGIAPVTFADTSATSAWVKAGIYDFVEGEPGGYVIPGDNKKYFVGARYQGSELVYFGFDDNFDQTVALDNDLNGATEQFNFPYNVVSAWTPEQTPDLEMGGMFANTFGSIVMALYINPYTSASVETNPTNVAVTLSPNPANSQLVVESKLKSVTGDITYTIRDNAGRMVYNSSKTLNTDYDKTTFDVSKFAAGQYFIVITTDNGIKAERFTVQH